MDRRRQTPRHTHTHTHTPTPRHTHTHATLRITSEARIVRERGGWEVADGGGGLDVPALTSQSPSPREAGTRDPGPRTRASAATAHPTLPDPPDVNVSNPNKPHPQGVPPRVSSPPERPSSDLSPKPHRREVSLSAWPLGRARGGGARAGDYRGQWGGVSGGSVRSRSSCPVQIRKPPGEEEGGGGESATSGARGRRGGAQAAGVSAQGVGGAESPGRLRSREVSHRWPGAERGAQPTLPS